MRGSKSGCMRRVDSNRPLNSLNRGLSLPAVACACVRPQSVCRETIPWLRLPAVQNVTGFRELYSEASQNAMPSPSTSPDCTMGGPGHHRRRCRVHHSVQRISAQQQVGRAGGRQRGGAGDGQEPAEAAAAAGDELRVPHPFLKSQLPVERIVHVLHGFPNGQQQPAAQQPRESTVRHAQHC